MKQKTEYSRLDVDLFPDGDSIRCVERFLDSLKEMAEALNKSSEISTEGGASFGWKITIEAEGEWV